MLKTWNFDVATENSEFSRISLTLPNQKLKISNLKSIESSWFDIEIQYQFQLNYEGIPISNIETTINQQLLSSHHMRTVALTHGYFTPFVIWAVLLSLWSSKYG